MSAQDDEKYMARILNGEGDAEVEVDIRTLSADRLAALRTEAGRAGDMELVESLSSILGPIPGSEEDTNG